jgi:hypothetical protein
MLAQYWLTYYNYTFLCTLDTQQKTYYHSKNLDNSIEESKYPCVL